MLTIDPHLYDCKVEIAHSMSPRTARRMVQVLGDVPRENDHLWNSAHAVEVARWIEIANNPDLGYPVTVRPPLVIRPLIHAGPIPRESTTISALSPMVDDPDHHRQYLNLLKGRVDNWRHYLRPFFDAYNELQQSLDEEKRELERRRCRRRASVRAGLSAGLVGGVDVLEPLEPDSDAGEEA